MLNQLKNYTSIISRISLAIIFLLFGIDQLRNPEFWLGHLPSWINVTNFFSYVGTFNIIVGLALLIGFFTRLAALLATLHLFSVIIVLGYNTIAIRDFGLLILAVVIFINGSDKLCIDKFIKNK